MAKGKGAKNTGGNGAAPAATGASEAHPTGGASPQPQLDPEVVAKLTSLRSHVRESFGKVVMAMMMLPRYRHQTLADLQHLVLEPLIRDRIAIAQRASDEPLAEDMAGVAIWASVSEEVDAAIREQIKGGAWPLRLKAEDWTSGQINWLIDVIASDQRATASVIANFRQVAKEGSLRLHPLITRLVDEETLKKMGAQKSPSAAAVPEANAAASDAVN